MEVTAKLKSLRIAPRKVRLAVGLVRGQKIQPALNQLIFSRKHAALPVAKLIKSAVANAKNNFGLAADNLFIKTISVDGGAMLKRWMPRAHGRATPIQKKTSHINLVLAEIVPTTPAVKTEVKLDAPVKLAVKPNEVKPEAAVKIDKKNNKDLNPETDEPEKQAAAKREGVDKHARIEAIPKATKGFTAKVFNRKSGSK